LTVIVDYKAGNLTSVKLAFDAIGVSAEITGSPEKILKANRIVFPGVGAAGSAMNRLKTFGLDIALKEAVKAGKPFIGICLGSQIILGRSEEDGGVDGLGIVNGSVQRFESKSKRDKIPHMGWNSVLFKKKKHPVLSGLDDNTDFYFVHSYYPCPEEESNVLGITEYVGISFPSIVGRGNVIATQFHPEKSGRVGLRLLKNFCEWNGRE